MVAKLDGPPFPGGVTPLVLAFLAFAVSLWTIQSTDGGSAGWTMFAPTPELEAAVGDKLLLDEKSVIHASGPDVDYIHYAYVVGQTKAKLFIAYATYSSPEVAKRNLSRLAGNVSWSKPLQILGHNARYLPKGPEREHMDANLIILIKNELVMIRGENMKPDDATRQRFSRVAHVVLNPSLRGHL